MSIKIPNPNKRLETVSQKHAFDYFRHNLTASLIVVSVMMCVSIHFYGVVFFILILDFLNYSVKSSVLYNDHYRTVTVIV